jgi:hypothetical protein
MLKYIQMHLLKAKTSMVDNKMKINVTTYKLYLMALTLYVKY